MKRFLKWFLFLELSMTQTSLLICFSAELNDYKIISQGYIDVKQPGFIHLLSDSSGVLKPMITTFGYFFKDSVISLENTSGYFSSQQQIFQDVITQNVNWPNEIQWVDESRLGRSGWIVAGGFLLPGKTTGGVYFIDEKTRKVTPLTQKKEGYFYSRTQWVHWGPEQSWALLTARAKKSLNPFEKADGELVLLTPTHTHDGWIEFEEKVLAQGPDVFFQAVDLNGDGIEELIATEFFGEKIELFWWDHGLLHRRTIADDIGPVFDSVVTDLNGDGRLDVVVTNHLNSKRASVFVYEVPPHFKVDPWTRHTLISGIETRQWEIDPAAPGSPVVFYPEKNATGKPWLMISGDGSQRVHLLTPHSEDPLDWSYEETIILDAGSTIGKIAVGDVNQDGFPEIFIPGYYSNKVYLFSVRRK